MTPPLSPSDLAEARELARDTLAQTGPNVIGSASWFRSRAMELAREVESLLSLVSQLTGEREEAVAALADCLTLSDAPREVLRKEFYERYCALAGIEP